RRRRDNTEERKERNTPSLRSGARARATRLPDDWRPNAEDLAYAKQQGLTEHEALREAEKFRNYWHAKPGGTKLDWAATWRNWCIRAAEERDAAPLTEVGAGAAPGFYAGPESPQLAAWDQYCARVGKLGAPRDRNGGWRFPSEWPPDHGAVLQ